MPESDEILRFLFTYLEPFAPEGLDWSEDTDLVGTLGIDSTTVIDLVLELEDEFGVAIPLNALADVRTAGHLAALVRRSRDEGPE